jgi:hypothetical protein
MRRAIIFALLVVVACASGAVAQTLTGTVQGKVTDEQGGVLPGVTVTLTGRTGAQTQVSDAQGAYRFIGLQPGAYSVKAELSGFKPKEQTGIDVGIGKTVDLALAMSMGGLTETVEVVANAVTIDTTTTATDTNMSQDLLFSMPINVGNAAANIMNYSPGINSGSAFGGASDGGNALMLDGVDTRDPEGGTAWTFFNYNIIEEVQVGGLGQPAEYGGFTGAVVNSITKSGGNRFSFLADWRYSNDSLAAKNNASTDQIKKNVLLGDPGKNTLLNDYTVQLGGPIAKDKLFFFLSGQRYQIKTKTSGSKALRQEVSPRFNFKATYQPTANDTLVGSIQYDSYNQKGRIGLIPGYIANDKQTIDQDSPEAIWNAQYRKVFNSSTFFEVKWTGYWGYYDLNPVDPSPTHYDWGADTYSGGSGYTSQYDRTRNQVNAALTKYVQKAGTHNFKFGVEIERSKVRDRFNYQTAYFVDYYGTPSYAYGYSYDLQGKNKRESYYAQDQWKLNRVTLNLGVRADSIRGAATTLGKNVYSTFSVGPRLGFAWDLGGKGNSVLKGYYGQLYDSAVFSSWSRAVPGLTPTYTWELIGQTNWKLPQPTFTARNYTVADNLKHPRVDEFNVAYEQMLKRDYKFTATYIKRDWKNFINSYMPNAVWAPYSYTNPLTSQPLTLYKWVNSADVANMTIDNIKSVTYKLNTGATITSPEAYRSYRGLMLVFQRAMRNRWQAQLSYVYSKTKGTINNGTYSGISSAQYENATTALVNTDGDATYGRPHEFKVFAGVQIPVIEVSLDGYFRWMSGTVYTPYSRVRGSTLGWPFNSYVTPNLVAPGQYRNDNYNQTDLRAEKVFNVGYHRFGVYADLQNLFNQGIATNRQDRYPYRNLPGPNGETNNVAFGDPRTLQTVRQATLGFRWSF